MKEKFKNKMFANGNLGGGGILNNKAFTLIELLAIIVILAIIAVITVPIILNIIDNSKKGAATDSAYGFKDAVNKWYVERLASDHDFMLKSAYTVQDGKIKDASDSNDQGTLIPVSGEKPSSGELHYSNNVLTGGCLVVGDYEVTFKSDGSVDKTEKGDCSSYEFTDPNMPTMAEMCPGCVFVDYSLYPDTNLTIGTSVVENYEIDYKNIEDSYAFIGLKLNDTTKVIEKAYLCGNKGTIQFCVQGYTNDSEIIAKNKEYLDNAFKDGILFHNGDNDYTWYENKNQEGIYVSTYIDNESGNIGYEFMGGLVYAVYQDGRAGCYSS